MKRILWLTLLAGVVGATAAGADPFPASPLAPVKTPAQYEHHTYCYGWSYTAAKPVSPNPRPLVWVLDGAGDLKGCSGALAPINTQDGSPLELVAFPWSHGHRRLFLDQTDGSHAKSQGMRLRGNPGAKGGRAGSARGLDRP